MNYRWLVILLVGCVQELPTLVPRGADASDVDASADVPVVDVSFPDVRRPDASTPSTDRTLAAGDTHTCAVAGRQLVCFGSNARGQLGLEGGDRLAATLVEDERRWLEVTAGGDFSCGRVVGDQVLCWGDNSQGQLGDGTFDGRPSPAAIPAFRASVVQAGNNSACALTEAGGMQCWGSNAEGQVGVGGAGGTPPPEPSPALVSVQDWVDIDVGGGHACALSGTDLYCWGRNSQGQLGLGEGAPLQLRTPTFVEEGDYQRVVVGTVNGCALDDAGALYCWGDNAHGQLGTGDGMDAPVPVLVDGRSFDDIDIDTFHACAITRGELYCWGRNAEGQLGLGDNFSRALPERVGTLTDWVEVAVGRFHTCAKRSDGSIWCTGANADGRLGVGDTERRREFSEVILPGPD